MNWAKIGKILFAASLIGVSSLQAQEEKRTEEVRFQKEELARETVLPNFRNKSAVKNRSINLTKRFDVSILLGKTLNDAFYDNIPISFQGAYNFSEVNGVLVDFISYSAKQNSFVGQVKEERGTFDLANVPLLQSSYSVSWQYTPYYGKVSFSKNNVYNLSVYTLAGIGKINYTNASSTLFQIGAGQKLYFTPNWGIKLDLKAKFYKFVDFLGSAEPAPPLPEANTFNLEMSVGVVYLL